MARFKHSFQKKGESDFLSLIKNLLVLFVLIFILLFFLPKEDSREISKSIINKEEVLFKESKDGFVMEKGKFGFEKKLFITIDIDEKNMENEIMRIQNILFEIDEKIAENLTISVVKIRIGSSIVEKFKIGPLQNEETARNILNELINKNVFGEIIEDYEEA